MKEILIGDNKIFKLSMGVFIKDKKFKHIRWL